jgi:hypothetical protein
MKQSLPMKGSSTLQIVSRKTTWLKKWWLRAFPHSWLPNVYRELRPKTQQRLIQAINSHNRSVNNLRIELQYAYDEYKALELKRRELAKEGKRQ